MLQTERQAFPVVSFRLSLVCSFVPPSMKRENSVLLAEAKLSALQGIASGTLACHYNATGCHAFIVTESNDP